MTKCLGLVTLLLALGVGGAQVSLAQESDVCLPVVQAALASAAAACEVLGGDQVCYAYGDIEAELEPGAAESFSRPGDIINLESVLELRLSALDAARNTWGMAALRLFGAGGEDVFLLVFGAVTLRPPDGTLGLPGFTLIGGQGADDDTDAGSGDADAPCLSAPPDGVLVYTAEAVALAVNGAAVLLDGAAFFQASAEGGLVISALEGSTELDADGEPVTIPAGWWAVVPLAEDEAGDLLAAGAPETPEAYDEGEQPALPLDVLLGIAVSSQFALAAPPQAVITCDIAAVSRINRRGGPGTRYPIVGAFGEGETAIVNGKATGTDDLLWWRLDDLTWVRADLVSAPDDCDQVLEVEAPELAAPAVTISGYYYLNACTMAQGGFSEGEAVQVFLGTGAWSSAAEARSALPELRGTVSVNDLPLSSFLAVIEWGPNNYGVTVRANWMPTPGTHIIKATLDYFGGVEATCTVTVP